MGLKIVIPIGYQRVKRINLTAMPGGRDFKALYIFLLPLKE